MFNFHKHKRKQIKIIFSVIINLVVYFISKIIGGYKK